MNNCQMLWIDRSWSGGFPRLNPVLTKSVCGLLPANSVDKLEAGAHRRQQVGAIEPPPALLGHVEQLKRHQQALGSGTRALGRPLSPPHGGERRLNCVGGAQSHPEPAEGCFRCSAGRSKKVTKRSQWAVSDSTALGDLMRYAVSKRAVAASQSDRWPACIISCRAHAWPVAEAA